MLNNKKIFIYNLCVGLSKLCTNIQQNQKAKLDYHINVVCVYGGRGGVAVRVFKMFCQRGQIFFYLLCVCGERERGGGVSFSTPPFVKKPRPPPINK